MHGTHKNTSPTFQILKSRGGNKFYKNNFCFKDMFCNTEINPLKNEYKIIKEICILKLTFHQVSINI